jgi:hypothetical protein
VSLAKVGYSVFHQRTKEARKAIFRRQKDLLELRGKLYFDKQGSVQGSTREGKEAVGGWRHVRISGKGIKDDALAAFFMYRTR